MLNRPQLETKAEDRWAAQLRKGTLEMAVLATCWQQRRYGWEILRQLEAESALVLTEGTLYPLLNRLKTDGLLAAAWVEAEAGHPRKYYSLTAEGRARLRTMTAAWMAFSQGITHLVAPILEHPLEVVA